MNTQTHHVSRPSVASSPATVAEAGVGESRPGGSLCRWQAGPVPHIEARDGWTLLWADDEDSDGFFTKRYIARGPDRDVVLDHCRFSFNPTQARFDWFVRNGFPRRRGIGPWNDRDVDFQIARYILGTMQGEAA